MGARELPWALMALLSSCLARLEATHDLMLPDFKDVYHVSGILFLPFAEIEEPFEAWYNLSGEESRIEFYKGQVITFQHGFEKPFGIGYKITPETTETEVNVRKCFQVNGTAQLPILPQSVLPSLKGFKLLRKEHFKRKPCTVWQNVTIWGKKKNVYTLWVTNTSRGAEPVHYEMRGYNSLLGSHYDKYEVTYYRFSHHVCPSVFQLPKELKCEGFPGPGVEHQILANPMQDYFGRDQGSERFHQLFHHYAKKYGKEYSREEDLEFRKQTFMHNMRYVHSKNRANLPYKLALNHLADRTGEELAVLRGRQSSKAPNGGLPFPAEQFEVDLPDSIDWRLYGTGRAQFIEYGTLISGADFETTYAFKIIEVTVSTRENTLQENASNICGMDCQNGYCHYNQSEVTAKVSAYINVTSGNITALKTAIFKLGPVAVSIDASHKSFAFYANGIYYEPACGNKTENLDHAVLAVGFGVLNDETYWLVKNSWSTYWGNDGYVLMSMKDNNCGVATDATYPLLA